VNTGHVRFISLTYLKLVLS